MIETPLRRTNERHGARPLQEAGPIACTISASGKARVTSPAPQRRLRSSERHRRGETDRVDCVRIVHKTVNVLNKLPKSLQAKAKRALQDIWMAETKEALAAFDAFVETYGVKYDKAVACLAKDRDALLAFYDFPAEHWKHLRTTNPIESTFATIRHRTVRAKGLPVEQDRARPDLQAGRGCRERAGDGSTVITTCRR